MAKVIVKQQKKKDPEMVELYELYQSTLQNDTLIVNAKYKLLQELLQKFTIEVNNFSLALCKCNVPIDDSLVNFTSKLLSFQSYDEIKNSDAYVSIMETCALFKTLFENFEIKCKNDEIDIQIFAFSQFNFKSIFMYCENLQEKTKLLEMLESINQICLKFVKEAFEPPFDTKKLSDVLTKAILTLESKIPRCQDAFNVLKRSAHKLNENFNQYYKESILTSNNQFTILNSFISDISKDPDLKSRKPGRLQYQFKKILMFLNDNYLKSMKNVDPSTNKLIDLVMRQL